MESVRMSKNEAAVISADVFASVNNEANGGLDIPMKEADEKCVILLKNASSNSEITFVVHAGNGIQGINDISVTVAIGGMVALNIDSGRFKNVSGSHKGCVYITSSVTTSTTTSALAAMLVLP